MLEKVNIFFIKVKSFFLKFYDIFLIMFAGIFVVLLFYSRLRPRIPKDLPITLSNNNVILYVYTIFVFSILIILTTYQLVNKNKNSSFSTPLYLLSKSMEKLYAFINKYVNKIANIDLEDYTILLTEKLIKHFQYKYIFYIITNVVPRFFVIIMFILDIFYFKKLHYFYISLILLIMPLITRAYLYSLKQYITRNLTEINRYIEISCTELNTSADFILVIDSKIILEQLALIQINKRIKPLEYWFTLTPTLIKELCEEYETNNNTLDRDNIKNFYKNRLEVLAKFMGFYMIYDIIKNIIFSWVNLIVFSVYLMGWFYILYTSTNILPLNYFSGFNLLYNQEEPFSGISLSMIPLILNVKIQTLIDKGSTNKIANIKRFAGSKKTAEKTLKHMTGPTPKPSVNKPVSNTNTASILKSKPLIKPSVTDNQTNSATAVSTQFNGVKSIAKAYEDTPRPLNLAAGVPDMTFRRGNANTGIPPSYELNHINLYDKDTNKAFAIATSQDNIPGARLISTTKLDGSPGNQYVAPYTYPRQYAYEEHTDNQGYIEYPSATKYFNQNDIIENIKEIWLNTQNNTAISRKHKDDSSFYEENGQRVEPETKEKMPTHNINMSKLTYKLNEDNNKQELNNQKQVSVQKENNVKKDDNNKVLDKESDLENET